MPRESQLLEGYYTNRQSEYRTVARTRGLKKQKIFMSAGTAIAKQDKRRQHSYKMRPSWYCNVNEVSDGLAAALGK